MEVRRNAEIFKGKEQENEVESSEFQVKNVYFGLSFVISNSLRRTSSFVIDLTAVGNK